MAAKAKFKCKQCGKEVERYKSEMKRAAKNRFCSHRCTNFFHQASGGYSLKDGTTRKRGYVLERAPGHPTQCKGYVPQHRLVMERAIGRLLEAEEVVHHVNEVKDDNSLENLQLISKADHTREHHSTWVWWDDDIISITEAVKRLSLDQSSFWAMRTRRKLSHQATLDFYRKRRAV